MNVFIIVFDFSNKIDTRFLYHVMLERETRQKVVKCFPSTEKVNTTYVQKRVNFRQLYLFETKDSKTVSFLCILIWAKSFCQPVIPNLLSRNSIP